MQLFRGFISMYLIDFEFNSFLPNYTIRHNMFESTCPETFTNSYGENSNARVPIVILMCRKFGPS